MQIALHGETFVSSLVEVPDPNSRVRRMVSLDVRERHPPHEGRQIIVAARPDEQVPVVAQDAVPAQPHGEPRHAVGKDLLKRQKVAVLAKDAQTPIGSIEHMIHVSAQRDSLGSRHGHDCTPRA